MITATPNASLPVWVIVERGIEEIAGILLRAVSSSLERQTAVDIDSTSQSSTKRA
jgi:hypothetical protein